MGRTKVGVRVSERTLGKIEQAARRQRELLTDEELLARAEALAQEVVTSEPTRPAVGGRRLEIYTFRLNEEWYGMPLDCVQEIAPLLRVTYVPGTPDYVRGVANLRGEVVAVLDLKRFLDLPATSIQKTSHILIVRCQEISLGLLVDAMADMMEIDLDRLEPPLPTISSLNAALLRGVLQQDGHLLVLLDMDRIVASEKIKRLLDPQGRNAIKG